MLTKNLERNIVKKILKRIAYFFLGVIAFIFTAAGGLAIYFNKNKPKIVAELNNQISQNISGAIHIGDVQCKFLSGFPNLTLALNNVELKDSLWRVHKRTLLKAKEIEVQISLVGILRKKFNIHQIAIRNATIDLYKDKNGISNSNIFRPKPNVSDNKKPAEIKIQKFELEKVVCISENQQRNKLFHFRVTALKGKVEYHDENIKVNLQIETHAKRMAFNTKKGSFIKDKILAGELVVDYSKSKQKIGVITKNLKIGEDAFDVSAYFNLAKCNSLFGIDIKTKILWKNASNILANNISLKLNKFDMTQPIDSRCIIKGNLKVEGDPEIVVTAQIKNNELNIPDGLIHNCNFNAKFTNNTINGKGCNDANSAISIQNFSGKYKNLPFYIPEASINNLENPIARGKCKTDFKLPQLEGIFSEKLLKFYSGDAHVNLEFVADIEDLKMKKPYFIGAVSVKDAKLKYVPKNAILEKTDLLLNFTQNSFSIKKIKFLNEANSVNMEFTIDNYLNLYYNDPNKILINWNIYCPYINVKQFIGLLLSPTKKSAPKSVKKEMVSGKLMNIVDKCQVVLHVKADKFKYNNLVGTDAKAIILLHNNTLAIQSGWVATSGGTVSFEGKMIPIHHSYHLESKVEIKNVNVSRFLTCFDNFGINSFSPKSIQGTLSSSANLSGNISENGSLIANSLKGKVDFDVVNGALINFGPLMKLGKFAVVRDFKTIKFNELNGNLKLNGNLIDVNKLRISSSVVNIDANGVYSFDRGTNLFLDIPLRNPKNDKKITDKVKREAIRNQGIVLHLVVVDENGKLVVKKNKDRK